MKIIITKKDSTAIHVFDLDRADSIRCAKCPDKSQELTIYCSGFGYGPFSSHDYHFFYAEISGIGKVHQVAAEPSRIAELCLARG